jgi:hypothetical protein
MTHRSLPQELSKPTGWFFPFELFPLLLAMIYIPRKEDRSSERSALWLYWLTSVLVLLLVTFYNSWSPHHWVLAWVLPTLFLMEIGWEYLAIWRGWKWVAPLLIAFILATGLQTYLDGKIIVESGGAAWHGSSLSVKRKALEFIAREYSHFSIHLAAPGYWNNSLMGWSCLLALPGEFSGRVSRGNAGTVLIEERNVPGGAGPGFPDFALMHGWKPVFSVGTLVLWEVHGDPGPQYPDIATGMAL